MPPSKPIIIAYDISCSKTRAKVHRVVKEWSLGNQKSVYECRLTTDEARELFLRLSAEIDAKTDNLIMAWVEPRRKVLFRGLGSSMALFKKMFHFQ